MSHRVMMLAAALSAAVLALPATRIAAQDGLAPAGDTRADQPATDVGTVQPWRVFTGATAVAAGVGLRNRAGGAIEVSGLPGDARVLHAFLYWNVISRGDPPEAAARMTVRRIGGGVRTVAGTVVGTGRSPCWDGDRNTVYRARLPLSLATGNGTYLLTLPEGVAGRSDGGTPWSAMGGTVTPPHYNGASLILVAERWGGAVLIYDAPLAGTEFRGEGLAYEMAIPAEARGRRLTQLWTVNSDGQTGSGLRDYLGSAQEATLVNGAAISGQIPGSPAPVVLDSDWNGRDGGPVTQLWDTAMHNVSGAVNRLSTSARVEVRQRERPDCLVAVAAMLVRW